MKKNITLLFLMLLFGVGTVWADWTVSNANNYATFTYDGNPHTVTWTAYTSQSGCYSNSNCSMSSSVVTFVSGTTSATNPGTYTFTLHNSCSNHPGDITFTWKIVGWAIYNSTSSVQYDGQSHNAADVINITNSSCGNSNGIVSSNSHVSVTGGTTYATNSGSYSVNLSNTCNSSEPGHYGNVNGFTWSITQRPITSPQITVKPQGDFVYNVTMPRPMVSVYDALVNINKYLFYNTDYTRSTGSDLNVNGNTNGTVSYTIYGQGNYSGSQSYTYKIDPKPITHSDITVNVSSATYTSGAIDPEITIVDHGPWYVNKTLVENEDYTISYVGKPYINAGNYPDVITITGIGNYTGSVTASFTISPRSLNEVTVSASRPYDSGLTETADQIISNNYVKLYYPNTSSQLVWNTDYKISIANLTYHNAGTYPNAITLTAVTGGNYTGTRTLDFYIGSGIDLSSALVIATDTYTATTLPPGSSNTSVRLGSEILNSSTDYTITYTGVVSDYVDAKTYENAVIIRGINQYYGEIYANYTIQPRPVSQTSITVTDFDYDTNPHDTKNQVSISYNSNPIGAANYTVGPGSVTEAGAYTLTITGVDNSNLTGSTTKTLLVKKALNSTYSDDFTITPSPIPTQIYSGYQILPTVSVYDKSKLLTLGTDYSITYGANETEGVDVGIITINGLAPVYSGSKEFNFSIVNEFFTESSIDYHATSSTTASVGNNSHSIATNALTGLITIPATVTHAGLTFDVTGIERGSFNGPGITAVELPSSIVSMEDNSFGVSSSNVHYVDLSTATGYAPTGLERATNANSPFADVPKQALVYLNGAIVTGENYIYNIGGGNYRCDVFKIYDDINGVQTGFDNNAIAAKWGMMIPIGFRANTVTNTRQLLQKNTEGKQQGYTTCLPYDLPIPSSFKAYTLAYSKDAQVGFTEVTTNTLTALTPYVLIPSASGTPLSTTNAEIRQTSTGITYTALTPVTSAASSGQSLYQMTGTMEYLSGAAGKYIMQSGNVWNECGATDWPNSCVLPMRAYISANGSAPAPAFLNSTFNDADGSTTNISNLRLDADDSLDGQTIFDLQGRKVTAPTKGVYIVNGKKRIIK